MALNLQCYLLRHLQIGNFLSMKKLLVSFQPINLHLMMHKTYACPVVKIFKLHCMCPTKIITEQINQVNNEEINQHVF